MIIFDRNCHHERISNLPVVSKQKANYKRLWQKFADNLRKKRISQIESEPTIIHTDYHSRKKSHDLKIGDY
jgi:hypothetical protein